MRRAAERQADAALNFGISPQTLVLAKVRGEEITHFPTRPGEREKPLKRLSGLEWLHLKRRVTVTQCAAGLQYGDDYRIAESIGLGSAINFDRSGGDGTGALQARMNAHDRLTETRRKALSDHAGMIELCDRVAGEGERIRDIAHGIESEAQKKEAIFITALDLLAKHYGMLKS